MPATQLSKELHPLCYEHHVKMRLNQSLLNNEPDLTQPPLYACAEPNCLVHYNIYRGYFLPSQSEDTGEPEMVPDVRCHHDGMPMYLAEINQEKKGFRLWICPQCDARRTNEEGLVGVAAQGIRDVRHKSGLEP